METAKGKAISGMFGEIGFKGKAEAEGTGTGVKRGTRSGTRRSAEGWGSLVLQRGLVRGVKQPPYF